MTANWWAFIEVKRVATKLSTRHLRQVEMYAVNEGVEWIILTNGAAWQVYHITGGLPVAIDLALEVDLLGDEPPNHKVNQLFYEPVVCSPRHPVPLARCWRRCPKWRGRRVSGYAAIITTPPNVAGRLGTRPWPPVPVALFAGDGGW